ncbi:MAG: hypothetical protein RLZZ511_3887 [Cyanobacteriota bacterium]|jgi:hypothetical protein
MKWQFRVVVLSSIILIPGLFLLYRGQAQTRWQIVAEVLPIDFQQQILKENLQPNTQANVSQMQVLKMGQLYLIDTRLRQTAKESQPNLLCGAENCLFLGYNIERQRVLNIYLNPKLPPKVPLIQPIAEVKEGLPCLRINQLEQHKLRTAKLCLVVRQIMVG